jgi:hypothetical protein
LNPASPDFIELTGDPSSFIIDTILQEMTLQAPADSSFRPDERLISER